MEFGEILSCIRKRNNVTQEELAAHLKVSRSTIAGYETRGREPEYYLLIKIADFFCVTTDELLGHDTSQCKWHYILQEDTSTYTARNYKTGSDDKTVNAALLNELIYYASTLSIRDLNVVIHMCKYLNTAAN